MAERKLDLEAETAATTRRLCERGETVSVAESCTGGLVAKLLTDLPGSSAWFEYGFVTYTNAAKSDLLGVKPALIEQQGAVSASTVLAMVDGVLRRSPSNWGVAISGIAGPAGGSDEKPVGTVWIAWGSRAGCRSASRYQFEGDRDGIRLKAASAALAGLRHSMPA